MIKKGIFLSFLTALISGVSIYVNSLFVSKTDPLIFSIIRNSVVAVLLTVFLYGRDHLKHLTTLTKKDWGMLISIGAIGGGIPFALFFTGLAKIGAVNGNILNKTLFLWVAMLAIPFLKERISKMQLIGYFTVFIALFVYGGSFTFVPAIGSYLVLAATVLWAIEHVIAKKTLQHVPSDIVAWARMVFGLPFLFLAGMVFGKTGLLLLPASYAVTPILVSSAFLVVYVLTWYSALSYAPATLVSSVLVIAPVVTALLGVTFASKAIPAPQMSSYAVLLVGVLCIVIKSLRESFAKHHG